MKLLSALRQYFSLNSSQRQFISKGQWAFNQPPQVILNFLKPLAHFDEDLDKTRSQLIITGVFGLIAFFIALIVSANELVPEVIAWPMVLSLLVIGIGSFLLRWLVGSFDIHNNLRNFIVPIINTVSQDVAADRNMILKIDLRGKTYGGKKTNQVVDDPGWFRYPKITTTFFKDYWFICNAPLVDGSNLTLTVVDAIRRRNKAYKSSSGKFKSKTKLKIKHKISAGLSMKNKTYDLSHTGQLKNSCDRLKVKDKQQRKSIAMVSTAISTDEDAHLEPRLCLNLIGKIFMSASPATAKGA